MTAWASLESTWRASWKPPERYTPAEWAERNFVLPAATNAESGRFKMSRTPYLAGIVNAVLEPGVEEIVFVKPTRVGGTTAGEIILGYWIDNDPGPCLSVLPTEADVEDEVKTRTRPMLEACPSLKQHLSPHREDNTLSCIKLDTMPLHFGWGGSPASLARRTCRYVRFDEVDKYPPFSGRESDPISLGKERTATYLHRRKVYITSSPTTREGAIWRAWEGCGDRRHYEVPCPQCGVFQRLTWPQVKWPKNLQSSDKIRLADEIERSNLAWYECSNPDCKGRIEQSHKPKMLELGQWVSVGQASKRVGFHLSSLYSPWRSFGEMAAEWLKAEGDIARTMNFRNSWLAEPFEVQVSNREPSVIRGKSDYAATLGQVGKERVAPEWSIMLLATCDVQKDHAYWEVSAWGYEMQSKRIAIGVATTLDEVYRHVFSPDVAYVNDSGVPVQVSELIVDSGYRKDEVTEFARRDPQRIRMAKGLATYFGPIADPKIEKASGVLVWNINTMQSKDTLDRLMSDPDPLKWQVFANISDDYCAQLASERKIIDPQTKMMVWKEKSSGAANHWWDCEAMACAVASAKGAAMPKPVEAPVKPTPDHIPSSDFMNRGRSRW